MNYSEQKAMAELGKHVRDWLRSSPGPLSAACPKAVYELAVERFREATGCNCEYGFMVDSLFSYGIQADQVGAIWWLRIPGKNRDHLQVVDSPIRIA